MSTWIKAALFSWIIVGMTGAAAMIATMLEHAGRTGAILFLGVTWIFFVAGLTWLVLGALFPIERR